MKKIIFLSAVLFLGFIFNHAKAQTTITLQPGPDDGKDATVVSKGLDNNQGDREGLTASTWTYNEELMLKRFYVAFDLSSIPENSIITDARLSLYYNPTDPYESWDYHTGENDLYIQRVTSEWDEHTIVWSNQPSTTTENQVELPPSIDSTQDYLDIDVTNMVIDMVDPAIGNNGFMIRMVDEFNYYKGVIFASSDHADFSLHPELKVCFNLYTSNPESPKETLSFQLFPNPASQTVTIELDRDTYISLEIINTHGQLVRKLSSINQTETIDISNLSGGTYIVRLVDKDIVLIKKLIVK